MKDIAIMIQKRKNNLAGHYTKRMMKDKLDTRLLKDKTSKDNMKLIDARCPICHKGCLKDDVEGTYYDPIPGLGFAVRRHRCE